MLGGFFICNYSRIVRIIREPTVDQMRIVGIERTTIKGFEMATRFESGRKVKITPSPGSGFTKCVWWPKGEVTGTIQKCFKNGTISVAVDQLKNLRDSGDGLRTLHFAAIDLAVLD